MASFSDISIRFNADLAQFSTEIQNAQRKMDKFGQKLQKVGAGLTLGVTLPILGLGAAAVKAASDAEETTSKFQTVFRDVATAAQASADVLRNSYGLSSQASQQLLGDTGDLLTGFGFSQKAALDLSTEVNKLAVDLASFTNFSGGAEGASAALTKALLGERESVKSLGISILEVDVKAKMLQQAQEGLTFETERQAKAFATLTIAQEQSKNAIGDYARTSDSFANQMRLLKSRLNDVAVEFGVILLPYVTKLAQFVGKLIEKFSGLSETTKKVIVVVGLLAAAIGPLLVVMGVLMTSVIPGLITAFTFLSSTAIPAVIAKFTVLNAVMTANPIGLVIAGVSALTFAFTAMVQEATPAVSKLQTFVNLVQSGGNYTRFMALQLRDQAAAAIEATSAISKLNAVLGNGIDPRYKTPDIVDPPSPKPIVEETRKKISGLDFTGLNASLAPIQTSPFDLIAERMPDQVDSMSEQQMRMMDNALNFNEGFTSIIQDTAASAAEGFGQIIGAMASGNFSMASLGQLIGQTLGDMAIRIGKMAIGIGLAVEGIKKALESLAGPVAIAAGIALIALGTFAKSALSDMSGSGRGRGSSMSAFADGGLVYGPTVGLIGEYSGARNNPEVIAPLSKLKDMLSDTGGGQRVEVVGVLKGTDMHLQNARTQNYLKRRR